MSYNFDFFYIYIYIFYWQQISCYPSSLSSHVLTDDEFPFSRNHSLLPNKSEVGDNFKK